MYPKEILGNIERFIMILFLGYNQYSAIGLVLTAKSIARYDKISKEEDFAEYYLLGTLMSTACVVLCNREITIYSSCCNQDKGIYYYRTYDNSEIVAVDMHREDLDGETLAAYDLVRADGFRVVN